MQGNSFVGLFPLWGFLVLYSGSALADNAGPWGGPIKPPTVISPEDPDLLKPEAIMKIFGTGKPFTSKSQSKYTFVIVFRKDGTAQSRQRGQKKKILGKWRLSKTGYCTAWSNNPERCYTVRKSAAEYEVRNSSGGIVAYWKTR